MGKISKEYLKSTEIIDWEHHDVLNKARELANGLDDVFEIVRRCFEWVRDEIQHSMDYQKNPVTCKASGVLKEETGFCFSKSHLLAALLRANSIPTGLCYQRLRQNDDGPHYCLHGLNAVYLPEIGWYRVDARGNKQGVDAQFCPPTEKIAFTPRIDGETDLPEIWPEPLPQVINILQICRTYTELCENIPDVEIIKMHST